MTVEEAKGFTCRTAWTEAASPWYGVVGRPPLGMGWMGTCAITPGGATGGALRLLDRQRDAVSHFLTDRGATAARIARHSTRRRVSGFPTCAIWGRGSGSAAHLRLREFPLWHCHGVRRRATRNLLMRLDRSRIEVGRGASADFEYHVTESPWPCHRVFARAAKSPWPIA